MDAQNQQVDLNDFKLWDVQLVTQGNDKIYASRLEKKAVSPEVITNIAIPDNLISSKSDGSSFEFDEDRANNFIKTQQSFSAERQELFNAPQSSRPALSRSESSGTIDSDESGTSGKSGSSDSGITVESFESDSTTSQEPLPEPEPETETETPVQVKPKTQLNKKNRAAQEALAANFAATKTRRETTGDSAEGGSKKRKPNRKATVKSKISKRKSTKRRKPLRK
jgi:hypothetical protein